jgi:hypothetical protein
VQPALLTEAKRLEDEALEAGEESERGRGLRAAAAALRVRALGTRSYPVLVCRTCFDVTGWTDASGECDACLRRARLRSAYVDPRGGWVDLSAPRASESEPGAGWLARLASLAHPEESERDAWLSRVDPGGTGPVEPEESYEVEVAQRDELEALDRSGMLVRFWTATARFADGRWLELASTTIPRRDLLVPTEFPASLPTEQLAEAWGDYRAEVDAVSRRVWAEEDERREAQRLADAAYRDAMREQRGASDLLDEG